MKKLTLSSLLVTLLCLIAFPLTNVEASTTFKDVPNNSEIKAAIKEMVESNIIKGYPDNTFRPNENITREQAAIMLARSLKLDIKNVDDVEYKDVQKSHPYYKEIAAVTNSKIMQGHNNYFNPSEKLTRAQMAIILTRAYQLEGNNSSNFKDVSQSFYAYKDIDAVYSKNVAKGYGDQTFKPNKPITRAHFALMLQRAMNVGHADEITNLLKEVYANELDLNTYEFEGDMNLGLEFPQSFITSEEDAEVLKLFKDIEVDIEGVYQKDPMLTEMNMKMTLKGDVETTFNIPIVMNEQKIWMKLPNSPLMPLPEQVKDKFIEMDLAELASENGQEVPTINLELQKEISKALNDKTLDLLGEFYQEVDNDEVNTPEGLEVEKTIKFEVTNDSIKQFIEKLFNQLLPTYIELVDNPEYAKALDLTSEDIALLKESLQSAEFNIDEIAAEFNNQIQIKDLSQYLSIHPDKYVGYDVLNVDIDMNVEGESLGIKMEYDLGKSKVNEPVNFKIGIPTGKDVITFDELMEIE